MNSVSNFEKLLTSKVGRYCSEGFRNIDFSFSDFLLEEKVLKSNLHVDFSKYDDSECWLSKQTTKPHLRTTEYVVVSILMCELYLSLALKISRDDLAKSWVKQVRLKTAPWFGTNVIQPVSVLRKNCVKLSALQSESLFDVKIGNTAIQLTVAHTNAAEKKIDNCILSEAYTDFACFLQNLDFNFYKNGYKTLIHSIQDIKTDTDLMITSALIRQNSSFNRYFGIGTHFVKTMDIASFILVSTQLIQALICDLDNTHREKTENLWIKDLEINYPAPMSIDRMKEYVKCRYIKESRHKDQSWQVTDLRMTLGNIQAKFNVAYYQYDINLNENENKDCDSRIA